MEATRGGRSRKEAMDHGKIADACDALNLKYIRSTKWDGSQRPLGSAVGSEDAIPKPPRA